MVHGLNSILGAAGATVTYLPVESTPGATSLSALAAAIKGGGSRRS